ncbi:MAG: hypothetical protein HYY24_14640 [Verrucomicrobia bacterium]|nr:hypothetical protein [Verrucomicrobiota bacterium]
MIIPAIAGILSRHALPLGLKANAAECPWATTTRATFTLLRLDQKCVFATCLHVLTKLRELQRLDQSAEIVGYLVNSAPFGELNTFTLVDHDQLLDVAVFGGLEDTFELPGLQFIDYDSSYLADPVRGDLVAIVGYPAANVSVSRNLADFGYMFIGVIVSSVSELRIVLANEHGDREFCDYTPAHRDQVPLGGLSGSPAFVIRNLQYRFIGIVTDASPGDQTIIISRLGCLNPDGTLDHTRIPR